MSQYPFGYDPSQEEYEVDVEGTRFYRPRTPGQQSNSSSNTPVPDLTPTLKSAEADGSFDSSRIYKPRYAEEKPNNFGAQLMGATRPGSVLNIIGAMTGGAQARQAHDYNEAERRKFQDSIDLENARIQSVRWNAYATHQNQPAPETDIARAIRLIQDPNTPAEVKGALLRHLGGGEATPAKRTLEEEYAAHDTTPERRREIEAAQRVFHPPTQPRETPAGMYETFLGRDGKTWILNKATGKVMPAEGDPGGLTKPGSKPAPLKEAPKGSYYQGKPRKDKKGNVQIPQEFSGIGRPFPEAEAAGQAQQPVYATNGKERIMTTDGGKTWQPAPK